jgi:hypothetical protein
MLEFVIEELSEPEVCYWVVVEAISLFFELVWPVVGRDEVPMALIFCRGAAGWACDEAEVSCMTLP